MLKNTQKTYGSVAKGFHWLIALLILTMLGLGFVMTGMENTPDKFKLYGNHKSLGAIILVLALLRLLWKAINIQPVLPSSIPVVERFLI